MEREDMSNTHIPVLKQDKPKPRAARKIIWILLLLFIALLTILFFRSPISQVSEIQIKGNTLNTDSGSESSISESIPMRSSSD